MQQIIFLIVLIVTILVMVKEKNTLAEGVVSQDPPTAKLKFIIWILCFLNPIIAGAFFYYGWKRQLPIKAAKANQISLWAFFILLVLGIGAYLLFYSL